MVPLRTVELDSLLRVEGRPGQVAYEEPVGPPHMVRADEGPTPVEWVLHALASCLMAGIANIAAARGVTLHSVEATVEGDIDLRGILGLSKEVRNGYRDIRVTFAISGDASPETL